MTAGPRGSDKGITVTRDSTSWTQPSSLSAMVWSLSRLAGGSCSFSTRVLISSNVSRTRELTVSLEHSPAIMRLRLDSEAREVVSC